MPRIDHWEQALALAIETARAEPFVWGRHDCPSFAFETRAALTGGEDIAALWRGRYSTALGGQRVLRRLGWRSLEEMGRALLAVPLEHCLAAQRGDLVLARDPEAFGVVLGARAAFVAPEGLVSLPLRECRLAWRT